MTDLPQDLAAPLTRTGSRLGRFASRVSYFAELTSTNDVAAELASRGAPEGTTIVADSQTAGRGRRGRAWFSPPGAGLYTSVVLRPRGHTERLPLAVTSALTLAAGVALTAAIRETTGLHVTLKWPNDVVVEERAPARRRKLAGILTEGSTAGHDLQYAIVGFGINVKSASLPPDLRPLATSIEAELGRPVERGVVLAASLAALDAQYTALLDGRIDAILSRWRELAPASCGARVRWQSAAGTLEGVTNGIDDSGALLVRVGSASERVISGELEWL